ncbi:MAG TPA: kelch repeat-containing protein, partial [Acidobacteriota bacterium]|nr:kelch repeat-containing protein [Acidobacteriota bacterium]
MRRLFYQYLLVGGYLLLATALSFFSVTTSAQLNPQWIGVNALMPQAMHWSAVCTYDGKIYVFGGNANDAETNTTYIYDPSTDSWTQGADMPTPRYLCTAVEVGGKIYVMGGRQLVASLNPVNVNECYDPATNTWTTMAVMPNAIRGHAACAANGKIYVCGGNTGAYTDVMSVYDPTTNTWAGGTKMPAKAAYGGLVYSSSQNSLFWVGGVKSSTASATNFIGKVFAYSLSSNTWDAGTAMVDKTAYFGITANGDGSEIYIAGGAYWADEETSYPFTQIFYTASKTFDETNLFQPSPWNRNNSNAAFVNNTLYIMGGDGNALIDSCNPSTGEFYEPNFPINDGSSYAYISGGASAAINGKFYVVDGGFYPPLAGNAYAYDPSANSWTKKSGVNPAPRMYVSGGQWNDKVVVYGGMVEDGSISQTAMVYDPLADTFTAVGGANPNMTIFEAGAILNDKLYLFGGRPDPADAETLTNQVSILDLNSGTWSAGANLPKAMEMCAAAAYNNKIYIFGGIDNLDDDYINNTVYIYDPAANSFTTGPTQDIQKQAYAPLALPYGNYILVDSGYNLWYNDTLGGLSGGMLGYMQVYDPATNTFKTEAQRPFGKMRHCAAFVGGNYYSTGGEDPDWPVTRLDIGNFGGAPVCTVTCSASANPGSGQPPLMVNFTGSATASNCSGTPAYAWTFGDGGTSTEQNPAHTYQTDGTYTWNLTVTVDGRTCSWSGIIAVGDAAQCTVFCNATASPTDLIVAFTGSATASNCTGTPTYAWTFGDGGTSTEQNPTHAYAAAGSYDWTLTVTVDNETCSKTGTVNVAPNPCIGALNCASTVTITPDVPFSNTTAGQPANVCSYSCSSRYESGPEVVHKITTTQAGDMTATLTDTTAELNVFILLACEPNTCVSGGGSAASYDNAPAGTYYIVVDGFYGAQGNYTLTVRSCVAPTAPKITSIVDRNACTLTGVKINYTPGSPATRHDLYRNGVLVYADYPSGADYIVGDSSTGSFYVYAVNGFNCYTRSFEAYASDRIDCCVAPTMPEITSITDRNICLFSGVTINYTPGSPAARHDLYRNGVLVYPDFPSGGNYVVGDSSSQGNFCVYAENGGCNTRSYNVYGTDRNDCCAKPSKPKITSITDRDPCMLSGIRVNYTPGTPAVRHDLYKGAVHVYPDYPSGADYIVGDSSVGSFYVYAVNGYNCYTRSSQAYGYDGNVGGPPTAPTGIASSSNCTANTISWNSAPGAASYNVKRGTACGTALVTYTNVVSPYSDATAVAGTTYNYWVVAVNSCGTSANSSCITAARLKTPTAPTGVTASSGCAGNSISWNTVTGAESYDLFRGTTCGTVQATFTNKTSPFVDDTAAAGTTYYYWVKAINSCGTSSSSSCASVSSLGIPVAPATVTATSGCTGNSITWTASSGATSYNVLRGSACGTAMDTFTGKTSPFSDTTAVAGTTYNYWVVAINACGSSANSSCATATRLKAPTAPTGIIATPGCTGNTISWDSVQDATSYNVKRGTTCGTALATYTNVTSPYTDTSAVAGTTYNYWVLAVNACGTSSNSACVTAAKLVAPSTPSAPIYTNVSCNTVTVNWNGVSMASAYDLYRKSGSCGTGTLIAGNLAELSYNDGGLIGSAQYSYYLVAKNDCGSSASGGCSTVTTTATPSAPEAPVFSNVGCTSLTITWTGVSGASSYDLYRKIGSCGTGSLIASDISGISYVDTGLVGNTLYSYYLIAKNSCGSSDNGTCSSVTTSVCAPNIAFQAIGAYVQITGDSDSYFEKGEKWLVPVTVTNSGNIPATNVMANFTGNGITVCNNPGIFGTIEAGGSASFTFEFLIDSDFTPCGGNINFNLGSKTCAELTPAGTDETNLFSIQVGQIIAGSPTDLVLQPSSADSFVNQASAGTNYGSGMTISVQSRLSQAQRTLVMFDLSGIPEDSVINSATLELYASSAPTTGLTLNVHRITGTWTESAVTWTNQPAYNSTVDASLAGGTTAGWKIWNIASLVQEWINGTSANYGLTVKGSVENDKTALTYAFASKENTTTGNRPILR